MDKYCIIMEQSWQINLILTIYETVLMSSVHSRFNSVQNKCPLRARLTRVARQETLVVLHNRYSEKYTIFEISRSLNFEHQNKNREPWP